MVHYENYLGTIFDGTQNGISIIEQMFSVEISNEVYNLSEMM